jgi:hypothetical protein
LSQLAAAGEQPKVIGQIVAGDQQARLLGM